MSLLQFDLFGAPPEPLRLRDAAPLDALEAPALGQLDLFLHSPLEQALARVRYAVRRRDLKEAQTALHEAKLTCAAHALTAFQDACLAVGLLASMAWLAPTLALQLAWIEQHRGALLRFLPDAEAVLIEPAQATIAEALESAPADPAHPELHAAQIWLQLGQLSRARESLARDAAALTCPHRLRTQALVAEAMHEREPALEAWFRLCWHWPEHAERLLERSAYLRAHWARFSALDEPLAVAQFPAFAALFGLRFTPAQADLTQDGARLLELALDLTQSKGALKIERRAQLRALAPDLFREWFAQAQRT